MKTLNKSYNKQIKSNIDFKTIDTNNSQCNIENNILNACKTGFINNLVQSNLALNPRLKLMKKYIQNKEKF